MDFEGLLLGNMPIGSLCLLHKVTTYYYDMTECLEVYFVGIC